MFIVGAQKVQMYTIVLHSKLFAFQQILSAVATIKLHNKSQGLTTTSFMILTHASTG